MAGACVIGVLVLIAVFAPMIANTIPMRSIFLPPLRGPAALIGLARKILGETFSGGRLWNADFAGRRIDFGFDLCGDSRDLGSISGYFGGWVDSVIQRFTDAVMCFPSLIIIIAAVAIIGPSIYNVMIVIGLLTWPGICRLVRGQILSLREREFVEAARSMGARPSRIILCHLLPNAVGPITVAATFGVAAAILTEAGLSFLGLGVQPPTASWGNMINTAQSAAVLQQMPWLWVPAGIMIAISVLSINFIGDGLRDALDPRSGHR